MLTAVSIVREKELGSIANFQAAPVSRFEYLVGKQLPYIALAMASFGILISIMQLLFGNTVTGSIVALVLGALAFVTAATAFGLVISSFVRSQIAAVFATSIVVMIRRSTFPA
jgi:ribosome-dependent ATPase